MGLSWYIFTNNWYIIEMRTGRARVVYQSVVCSCFAAQNMISMQYVSLNASDMNTSVGFLYSVIYIKSFTPSVVGVPERGAAGMSAF
jgi:hypothetical protein